MKVRGDEKLSEDEKKVKVAELEQQSAEIGKQIAAKK